MCRENDLQDQSYGETGVVILQEYDCEGVSVLLEDDCVWLFFFMYKYKADSDV